MSADPARRPMTDEELEAAFQAVPPVMVAEIIDGELVVHPRPASRHTRAASRLGRSLGPFDDDPGEPAGWVILAEPEVHFPPPPGRTKEQKLVPDLAGWRRTRMPELPDAAAITLAPDWLCEVISPRTSYDDRTRKWRTYARAGVG